MDKDFDIKTVHEKILRDAEDLANQRVQLELDISGKIFRGDPVQSQSGGLTLSIDELIERSIEEESKIAYIYEIGSWALEEAVYNNQEIWVAMIFHEAHKGRNYFDRFLTPGEQTKLF